MTDDRLARILATGVTEAEVAEAEAVDVDMYDYSDARAAGATHDEVLEVGAFRYDGLCAFYTALRGSEGATHAEAMVEVRALATLLETRDEAVITADPERLAELATHEDGMIRWCVARNPHTPPEVLAKLAKARETRLPAAGNPSTPPEVLATLATHKAWNVHEAVLTNPSTPPEVLAKYERWPEEYWGEDQRWGRARPAASVEPEPPPPPVADQLQM